MKNKWKNCAFVHTVHTLVQDDIIMFPLFVRIFTIIIYFDLKVCKKVSPPRSKPGRQRFLSVMVEDSLL